METSVSNKYLDRRTFNLVPFYIFGNLRLNFLQTMSYTCIAHRRVRSLTFSWLWWGIKQSLRSVLTGNVAWCITKGNMALWKEPIYR